MKLGNLDLPEAVVGERFENGPRVERLTVIRFRTGFGAGFVFGNSGVFLPEQAVDERHVELDVIVLPAGDSGRDELVDNLKQNNR